MKIISLNVGRPKTATYQDKPVQTGIYKQPVTGPVKLIGNNLAGDGQADLKHHGGVSKAVYAYPLEHYAFWQQKLGLDKALPYGIFGENLTVAGLDETSSYVGDHWRVGSAIVAVTQPRVPCFKLGVRFGDSSMTKRFMDEALTGVYLMVIQEGEMAAGDTIELVKRGKGEVAIKPLFEAFFNPKQDGALALLERALEVEELSAEWRIPILKLLHN